MTSTTKPREWYVRLLGKGKGVPVIFERGEPRFSVASVNEVYMSHEERVARAERIAALWNACEPDGPVQRLIEVAERLANEYNFYGLDEAAAEVKQALGEQE